MHRHFEEVVAARAMLREGACGHGDDGAAAQRDAWTRLGRLVLPKDRVGGGVVLQLGIHGIDLVEHLFGPIVAVSARTATLVPQRTLRDGRIVAVENADTAFAVYEIEGGPLVHHEMSMIERAGTDRFRMEIYGD